MLRLPVDTSGRQARGVRRRMAEEYSVRDELRDHQRRITLLEVSNAVLVDFMAETRARNRALPGWLLAAAGLALPAIGAIASMWLAGKVP